MSDNVAPSSAIAVVRSFFAERGASAIEYAMIAAGIGATIAATVFTLGDELKTNFYDRLAALF